MVIYCQAQVVALSPQAQLFILLTGGGAMRARKPLPLSGFGEAQILHLAGAVVAIFTMKRLFIVLVGYSAHGTATTAATLAVFSGEFYG